MNSKKAKQLRQVAKNLVKSEEVVYEVKRGIIKLKTDSQKGLYKELKKQFK